MYDTKLKPVGALLSPMAKLGNGGDTAAAGCQQRARGLPSPLAPGPRHMWRCRRWPLAPGTCGPACAWGESFR